MKKVIFLFLLFAGTTLLFSQTTGQLVSYNANTGDGGISDSFYKYAVGSVADHDAKTSLENKNIDGSPYMDNIFNTAQLYYENEAIDKIYYRYNAYNEEIEIKERNLAEEPIKALGKDKKIRLLINGKPMSFKTFIDKNKHTKNGYLTLLNDGNYKLYKHLKVVFKEAKKAENSFVKGSPAKFIQFTEYYLENEGGTKIQQIELNNKKIVALLEADKKVALKDFLKNKKIKIKNESNLIKAFEYLNTL